MPLSLANCVHESLEQARLLEVLDRDQVHVDVLLGTVCSLQAFLRCAFEPKLLQTLLPRPQVIHDARGVPAQAP